MRHLVQFSNVMTTSVGQVLQMDMQMIQEMHCPIPHIYEVNRFKQLTAFF